ncbi:MAG: carboxypeptidase regulatory-like domain-containing protein [Ferruginibacter sp.]
MQHIRLSIPTPCHEDWNKMLPVDKGRFCNACAKQVVDFSTMSDAQVLNYFSNLKNESVCGRTYPDQLDRVMIAPAKEKRKRWFWNYVAFFLLLFSRTVDVKAQRVIQVQQQPVKDPQRNNNILMTGEIAPQPRIISGTITDTNGDVVSNATIILQETKRSFSADRKGHFSFAIVYSEKNILISAPGMESVTVKVSVNNNLKIILSPARLTGKIVVTTGMMAVRPVKIKKH